MKVIVVGPSLVDFGTDAKKFEVVGHENVAWAIGAGECTAQFHQLVWDRAQELHAKAVLFQETPPSLVAFLMYVRPILPTLRIKIGLIITRPSETGPVYDRIEWLS